MGKTWLIFSAIMSVAALTCLGLYLWLQSVAAALH
jgi:hypothetical protein